MSNRATSTTVHIRRTTSIEDRLAVFHAGWQHDPYRLADAADIMRELRPRHGFKPLAVDLIAPPETNLKLNKATSRLYGLTLQSSRHTTSTGNTYNSCPDAGQCIKVCVLQNGHGKRDSVQRGRDWRSEMLVEHPLDFLAQLGHELRRISDRAARTGEACTFRPNVNSDVDWHALLGDTLATIPHVPTLGYTKNPKTLDPDHPTGITFTAYSLNERSDHDTVNAYLRRGGNVSAVTNRKPGDPIQQWHPTAHVVDADKTDEWMMNNRGVIGELSAKGNARKLIGRTKRDGTPHSFVRSVEEYAS